MLILVGLGNPGPKYARTRHNIGWQYLDFVHQSLELPPFSETKKFQAEISKTTELILVKPQTYMNKSGEAVQQVLKYHPTELMNVIVVYDDLDIPTGKFKLQFDSGPKIHNGLNSIRDTLGSNAFYHLRIGVDSRNGDRTLSGQDYVLQPFSAKEQAILNELFPQITQELTSLFPSLG